MVDHHEGRVSHTKTSIKRSCPFVKSFIEEMIKIDKPQAHSDEVNAHFNRINENITRVAGNEWQTNIVEPILDSYKAAEIFSPSTPPAEQLFIASAIVAAGFEIADATDAELMHEDLWKKFARDQVFKYGNCFPCPSFIQSSQELIGSLLVRGVKLSQTANQPKDPFREFVGSLDMSGI